LAGNFEALNKFIPALKTATSETEKAIIVSEYISRQWALQKKDLDTVAGAWASLKGRIGDVWEMFGKAISQGGKLPTVMNDINTSLRTLTEKGDVQNEGDVQSRIRGPYRIDYGAVVPRKQECDNLYVTFCVSASHIAFGSIRMAPVFMCLAQSAVTAGVIAIEQGIPIQDVKYQDLKPRLLADGQKLELVK
jgi:hypothetical protein